VNSQKPCAHKTKEVEPPTHGFSVNGFRNRTSPEETQQNVMRQFREPVGALELR